MKRAPSSARNPDDAPPTRPKQSISVVTPATVPAVRTAAAASGALAVPWIVPASALGADGAVAPSERITVGLIGHGADGPRPPAAGWWAIPPFKCWPSATWTARGARKAMRCVDETYAAERASGTYRGCAAYNDYRELLARPDIDAVVIATPDHWHTLQSIDAAKAGKDVYCEKPISLTIQEGRQLVETVRRYGRVFQTGTQYRSIPTIRQVCEFVRGGGLGQVKSVFTIWNDLHGWHRRPSGSSRTLSVDRAEKRGRSYVPLDFPLPAEPVPEGLDWDLWVGPAPWHAYNRLYHIEPVARAWCRGRSARTSARPRSPGTIRTRPT